MKECQFVYLKAEIDSDFIWVSVFLTLSRMCLDSDSIKKLNGH